MAISLTLGGNDRTAKVDVYSIVVSESPGAKANTMSFDVPVEDDDVVRPLGGQEVVLTDASREFAGILVSVKETQLAPRSFVYRCTARDYTYLFDRRLVVEDYAAQRADLIVADVVSRFTSGFTSTGVKTAFDVPEQKYDHVYPSEIVQGLADQLEWQWYIDYLRDVRFFAIGAEVAPIAVLDLEADTRYHDLALEEDVAQWKNRIYVKGFKNKSTGTYQRAFTGDGSTKFFHLGYEPGPDLADTTVTVDGVARTLKVDIADNQPYVGGADSDVYVCFGNMGMRFNVAPASGLPIVATFPYMFEALTVVEDPAAQTESAAREGGDGVHEYVHSDPGLTAETADPAAAKGNMLLLKYGWPIVTGNFGTFVSGWRPGQSFRLKSSRRFKDRSGNPIDQQMYVHTVEKTVVQQRPAETPVLHYAVGFGDSPFVV